jgi:hypothetical protein
MDIGAVPRSSRAVLKPGLGKLLALGCLCAAAVSAFPPDSRQPPAGPTAPAPQQAPETATWRSGLLPKRESIGEPQGALFAPIVSAAPSQPLPADARAQVAPVAVPVTMPYRIAGQVIGDGAPQIVFARGDRVVIAAPGDALDDDYRLESVRPGGVTLIYLPLNRREELAAGPVPLAESTAPAVTESPAEPSHSSISARLRSWRRLVGESQ